MFFLLNWTTEWIASYWVRNPSDVLVNAVGGIGALVIGLIAFKHPKTFTSAKNIADELTKVTWPSKKDTQAATVVVLIMTVISAIILGLYDWAWSWITDRIYG